MKLNNSVQKETRKITWSYKETKNKQKMMRHPRETVEKRIQNVKKMEKIIFLGEKV